jgi:hypothetical protein
MSTTSSSESAARQNEDTAAPRFKKRDGMPIEGGGSNKLKEESKLRGRSMVLERKSAIYP